MGMRIGSNNSYKTSISLKKPDGSVVATISFSKPKAKKKKRLSYNFKKISNQILMSKTSANAGKVLNKARVNVITLLMQKKSGDYDDKELKDALEHARSMERIAKKRKKHMEEEERAEQGGETLISEGIEENSELENTDDDWENELSDEELQELAQELKELTEESLEESLKEMADELISTVHDDMSKEEIDDLKRRHRADELKAIIEADMKYLKALFEKLQKEKEQGSSSSSPVSLEIAGVEIPVQAEAAPVDVVEGAAVDVSV